MKTNDPNNDTNPSTPEPHATPTLTPALDTFDTSTDAAVAALSQVLKSLLPDDSIRHQRLGLTRARAVPTISSMLRSFPDLSATFTADDIDTAMAEANRCSQLALDFIGLAQKLKGVAQRREEAAWQMSSDAYATAVRRSARDIDLEMRVAPIQDMLAIGPLVDVSAIVALKAQQKATKATARATKAQETAKAHADRVKTLEAKQAQNDGTAGTPTNGTNGP